MYHTRHTVHVHCRWCTCNTHQRCHICTHATHTINDAPATHTFTERENMTCDHTEKLQHSNPHTYIGEHKSILHGHEHTTHTHTHTVRVVPSKLSILILSTSVTCTHASFLCGASCAFDFTTFHKCNVYIHAFLVHLM